MKVPRQIFSNFMLLGTFTPKFHIPLEFPLVSQINLTDASGAQCYQKMSSPIIKGPYLDNHTTPLYAQSRKINWRHLYIALKVTGSVAEKFCLSILEEKKSNVDLLILDLDSLPTPLLVSMMIRCNDEIQNQQDNLNPYLMTVVGMLVSVLGTRDVVTEGGEQSSGAEYRDRVNTEFCESYLIIHLSKH